MKFFFCETCGKRLTDADLAAGQARDKQVKGIYCADCAQSVMTMEFGALKEEQARALLKDPPNANAGPAPELPHNAPPNTIPVTTRRGARNSSTERLVPQRAQHKAAAEAASGVWITFVAGGAVLALGLVLYFAKASNTPSAAKNAPARPAPVPVVESTPAPVAPPERISVPGPQAVVQAAPASKDAPPENAASSDADVRARADFEALNRKLAELPAATLEQKKELAEAFLKAHGESLLASRVRVMMRGWEAPAAPIETKSPVEATETPAAPPSGNVPPKARLVVWDGKGIRGGSTWVAPGEGGAEIQKVEHPDETKRQVLKFVCTKPGYCAFGFNWHGWNPSAGGSDLTAANHVRLRLRIDSDSKPTAGSVALRAVMAEPYYSTPIENLNELVDGRWHDVLIPLDQLKEPDGKVLDRSKVWELKFDLFREGQPTTIWIARIAFE